MSPPPDHEYEGPWRVGRWLGRGRCLAENEASGRMLAVGGTAPGERVLIDVERTRWKTWGTARETLSASHDRVTPRCPHVTTCPGCVMLHVSESAEDHYKATVVSEVFSRVFAEAGLTVPVPSPAAVHRVAPTRRGGQRVRATLAWRLTTQGCELGLRRFDGAIANAPDCDANTPEVRALCATFVACWPSAFSTAFFAASANEHVALADGTIAEGTLDVSAGAHGHVLVWLSESPLRPLSESPPRPLSASPPDLLLAAAQALAELVTALPEQTAVELAVGDPRKPHERRTLARRGEAPSPAAVDGVALAPSALGWTQPTPRQATEVYRWVVDELDVADRNVLDIGSATGGLSLAIGRSAASVLGVDVDYRAVQVARESAALCGAEHVTFRGGKAETVLPKLAQSERRGHYTRALVNPFRSPLGPDAMLGLVALGVERIVYLAPSPTAGAKDIVHLLRAGFALQTLGVASLHPGTAQGMACAVLRS